MLSSSVSYDEMLGEAEEKTGTRLKKHTNNKAVGPCPSCGGNDRFVVWLFEQKACCMHCKQAYSWGDPKQQPVKSKEERREDAFRARAEMSLCHDWVEYAKDVEQSAKLWANEGFGVEEVKKWGLGWCPSCPLLPAYGSLTIPVFYGGVLVDIRHKLLGAPPEMGKYRSHRETVIPFPFHADITREENKILVVEGEKKAMLISEELKGTLGIPGTEITHDLIDILSGEASKVRKVTLALDPGAEKATKRLASELIRIGIEVSIADFFCKPDDLLRRYGALTFRCVLKQARKVAC